MGKQLYLEENRIAQIELFSRCKDDDKRNIICEFGFVACQYTAPQENKKKKKAESVIGQ